MKKVKISKLFIDAGDGTVAEFEGGDGTRPAPNSVGTAEIEDEGVKKEDLDKTIQDQLEILDDSNIVTEDELEQGWKEAMHNAGMDIDITE